MVSVVSRFAGSNPAVAMLAFLRREVKSPAPCRKIYGVLIMSNVTGITSAKFKDISYQLCFATSSVCCSQRTQADESGVITSQMWPHNRSDNGRSAWDAL
jgi:hypothetical protein